MKRSFIIALALIAAIAVPLCASSGWARGLGVLGLGAASTPLIYDDFADSATIADYTNIAYTLSISGGAAHGSTWQTTVAYHETPTGSNDHWVAGDIIAGVDNSGLILGSNGTDYYFVEITSGYLRVISKDTNYQANYNGSYTDGAAYSVAVQIHTNNGHARFRAWVGGSEVTLGNAENTGDNVIRGQYVGVRIKRNSFNTDRIFDNLSGDAGEYTP